MLSAARNCRNSALSKKLFDRIRLLFPNEKSALTSASILMNNTYLSEGNHHEAEKLRTSRINQLGANITPGISWTLVNGEIVVKYRLHANIK